MKANSPSSSRSSSPAPRKVPASPSPSTPLPVAQSLHTSLPCKLSGLEGALTLHHLVAAGSYGKVFMAKTSDGRLRAAKCIPLAIRPTAAEVGDASESSPVSEAAMMKHVKHSNVIRLYDSNVIDGRLWISMEYALHGNVTSYLQSEQRNIMNEDELATLATSVLRGLKCIHKRGVIHRDIKPKNILINHEGKVKLGDLGTACHTETQRHSVQGTFQYLAPEIFQYNGYDNKVDIWALGMTLLELAQGFNPFQAEHFARVLFHLVDSPTAPSLEDPSGHSNRFVDFLSKCLTLKAVDRPSAAVLLKHPFLKKAAKTLPLLTPKAVLSSKSKAEAEEMSSSSPVTPASPASSSSSSAPAPSSRSSSPALGFDSAHLQSKPQQSELGNFAISAKLIQAHA